MKKLLSILSILFLTTSMMWGATTLTLQATASPTDGGTLSATGGYVDYSIGWFKINYSWKTQSYSSADGVLTAYGKNECDGIAGYAASDMAVKIENITATANPKFYFYRWDKVDASGEVITSSDISNPFSLTHAKASGDLTVFYRATFKPLVETPEQVKMVAYADGIEDVSVTLPSVHNRTALSISISGDYEGSFQLAKKNTISFASTLSYTFEDGIGADKEILLSFELRYVGDGSYSQDEALNVKNTYIVITDNAGNTWNIPIVMTEAETYTFRGVANGTYSVDFVASDKQAITNIENGDTEDVELRGADYSIKLTATPASGYEIGRAHV